MMIETLKKIQELIEQNKILEQQNEELKNIISINLLPHGDEPKVSITDLIGITEIENLVFKFYQTYKIPVALFNNRSEIFFSIGWKKLFTSQNNLDNKFSFDFEKVQMLNSTIRERYYKQKSFYGFNTIIIPIEIQKDHRAALVFNQFLYKHEIPDYDAIRLYAKEYNLNEDLVLDLLTEIPVLSINEMDAIIKEGLVLADMIAFIGSKNYEFYKRFKQQSDKNLILNSLNKKICEQEEIIKALLKNIMDHQRAIGENTISKADFQRGTNKLIQKLERTETILNALLTSSPMGICFVKEGVITYSNDQMFQITGYTTKELLGRPLSFLLSDFETWEKIIDPADKQLYRENITCNIPIKVKGGVVSDNIGFVTQLHFTKPKEGYALSIMNTDYLQHLLLNKISRPEIKPDKLLSDEIVYNWSDKTILIAEDEELNYIYLKQLLKPTKINIKWAVNGQKAVEYFTEDPKINLVLMDIKMPVLNGIDATRIIKSMKKNVPVIAQTAYVQDNTREDSLKAGCDEYLAKPINSTNFFSLLNKYLSEIRT